LKLSIIVPVYNEIYTVGSVIQKLDKLELPGWEKEVIIVDDGSTDGTTAEITKCVNGTCCRYKLSAKNCGKGAAICLGAKEATGEYVLIQDSDDEYDSRDIPALLDVAVKNNADVVFGTRFHSGVHHNKTIFYYGNRMLTALTNLLYGNVTTDMETGYKLVRRELFNSLCPVEPRFGFEPQITARIAKRKIKVHEVPINYNPRDKAHGKKIGIKDGIHAILVLLRERFTR
jgi:glycosyltransferase involved in cell wall biosynthesis